MFSTHLHCKYINAETWLLNIIHSLACPGVTCHQECQEEASHQVPGSSAHELKAGGALGKAHQLKPVLCPNISTTSLVNTHKVQSSPP